MPQHTQNPSELAANGVKALRGDLSRDYDTCRCGSLLAGHDGSIDDPKCVDCRKALGQKIYEAMS